MTTRSIPEHMLLPSTCQSGLRHLVNARWDSQAVRNGSHSPRASCGVIQSREMVSFDSSEAPIAVQASELKDALFVLGSDELHLGYYSGHISAQALEQGVRRIAEQGKKLNVARERRTASGTIPVFCCRDCNLTVKASASERSSFQPSLPHCRMPDGSSATK